MCLRPAYRGRQGKSRPFALRRKCVDPVYTDERLQLKLALGGTRPPVLLVEVWDKDQNKPDDLIAQAEVALPEADEGSLTIRVQGVDGQDDVEELNFSFALLAESEEPELGADAAKEARPPRKPAVAKILEPVDAKKTSDSPKKISPERDTRARQKTRQI